MKRLIAWFVYNPVAANLLMFGLLIGGLLLLPNIRQEEFPAIEVPAVIVSVAYLGAAPEEVEEGVCLRIEEALDGTVGIDRMETTAGEGSCTVMLQLLNSTDTSWALGEVESRVGSISTFPVETEKPSVSLVTIRQDVLNIAVSGDAPERTLKEIGLRLREQIVELPGVSQVGLEFTRPYEISIEVSEQQLRRHGLTLQRVAQAVRASSIDMPGGSLKTSDGEILLRSKGQAYRGPEFEDIVVLTRPDGTTVTVGEIGTVVDGFADGELRATFDGSPAVMLRVSQVGNEDILAIAHEVKDFVERTQPQMPDGIQLTVWGDRSYELGYRLKTVLNSALTGLLLVLFVLTLFLEFRLALWVAAGIPVALLGTLIFFPVLGITVNSLSLIGFVLVLGVLVDDAIVIAERVHAHQAVGEDPRESAISGAQEVSIPVIFGVLTTIAAFLPLIAIPGPMGAFFASLGFTVVIALVFSIIESQLILPAHLSHLRKRKIGEGLSHSGPRFLSFTANGLQRFARLYYRPVLERAIEYRYTVVAGAVGTLIIALGLVASGRVVFQFFPSIASDQIRATLTMPFGTPLETTAAAVERMEMAATILREEVDRETEGESMVMSIQSTLGRHMGQGGPEVSFSVPGVEHLGEVALTLVPEAERDLSTAEFVRRWRELTGPVPEAVELKFSAERVSAGQALALQLSGRDIDELRAAAAELRGELEGYSGVFDISDSFRAGKREIQLSILPGGELLGLTQTDLARQVREAFYGAEVQRIPRGSEEVKVMVRYPQSERRSVGDLEDLRIRTADGTEVPFATVASAELGHGYAAIQRTDRRRRVTVTADVDRSVTTPEEVMASVLETRLPKILERHPGVGFSLEGEQRERTRAMGGLAQGFGLVLILIYALLAIPLKSYLQPLVIMSAIPFGAIGAVVGHIVLGWDLVFFSILGIVALSGVVVNDSLVLVDYVNRKISEGMNTLEAVISAGTTRFRAILLTSVTTLVGLLPLMFNDNPIVFPLVPIAISLGFGIVFATMITLILVPCSLIVLDDIKQKTRQTAGVAVGLDLPDEPASSIGS